MLDLSLALENLITLLSHRMGDVFAVSSYSDVQGQEKWAEKATASTGSQIVFAKSLNPFPSERDDC